MGSRVTKKANPSEEVRSPRGSLHKKETLCREEMRHEEEEIPLRGGATRKGEDSLKERGLTPKERTHQQGGD